MSMRKPVNMRKPMSMRKLVKIYLLMVFCAFLILWIFCLPGNLFEGTAYSTVVVDCDGELLGARIAEDGQWRFPPRNSVPEKYATALIQFEDRSFRYHPGVSPRAICRALVQNIRGGHRVSGASTISMQVIRLSRQRERTVWQKMVEMFLATRLEARYSKDEILALYASYAPFGGNVVGIDAAAWRYLGRDADELSWAEAATFAVLPNAPSSINLSQNRNCLLEKRNRLLLRLKDKGYMDEYTYESAIGEPLIGQVHPLPAYCPHLVEEYNKLFRGMLVKTGIRLSLQKRVEESLKYWRQDLSESGINDLAAIIADVRTGETIAYCGNADILAKRPGNWVDIANSPRSTGSILKPLLYCAALQEGTILPKSLLPDIPSNFGGFSPKNFDLSYDGAVPADEALARSLNIPNVYLLKQFGTSRFVKKLQKEGVSTLKRKAEEYGLSLILGGSEASLRDIVGVYSRIASAYQNLSSSKFSDKTAVWYMLEAMSGVGRPDRMDWRSLSSLRKVAWKTGTSYGSRDAWAIGITPDYVVGVWAGNAEGNSAPGLTGALTAGPIMFDLFNMLPPTGWFEEPSGGVELESCPESGYLAGRDCPHKKRMRVPAAAVNGETCPYHREVKGEKWFVLPPIMEKYYRIKHQDYHPLPRTDTEGSEVMHFAYPSDGAVLSPAKQMDGSSPGIRCEMIHSRSDAVVYWHLDNEYLDKTTDIHTFIIDIPPGLHRLTAVDDEGNKEEITIKILGM